MSERNKKYGFCRVISVRHILQDIYEIVLSADFVAEQAVPGQFVNFYSASGERLLPRPISICDTDKAGGTVRLVFRTVGEGTKEMSLLGEGSEVRLMGPLGHGYEISDELIQSGRAVVLGGGIGIPPMIMLIKELTRRGMYRNNIITVFGYRDETFLTEEIAMLSSLHIATDLGTAGMKGNVVTVLDAEDIRGDMIFACGPKPMLRAVKEYAEQKNIKAQISMEERMACGIGACLACITGSVDIDSHSNVNNKRICKDGPVFYADEIIL